MARTFPLPNIVALILAIGAPFVPVAALLGAATAVVYRRTLLAVIAVLVLIVSLAVQVPWYYFGHPTTVGEHTEVRVLSANLRKGQANPATIVRLAENSADVITVSELTLDEIQRFSRAGLNETFPYSILKPAPGAGGIGIWSRYPLVGVPRDEVDDTAIATAKLQIPGVRFDPVVTSVHLISPLASDNDTFAQWRAGISATNKHLDQLAKVAGPGAVIVGGDFNSTPDMRQFRDLLTNGYRDAVEQTGSGLSPTYPVHDWIPPLITIDHILTRNAAASSIKTVTIPGSDHRALLSTIKVPLDPTAS
ncbi:endonuclease/exonuclease/phosphatase family protein [Mycobacterium sp. 852013-51886_SCH5428379]|uniref:endonuclease/exonuclease/phosphatase family protein n=1 Tax=Mycobacterium sp. 852013-51886_SCH5428379 TaxID=1834111 RepID=UPI000A898363|nr:endonuclease/exonuclease/phosphatase family protein [Mycobacterium sp. 852013-51886_SCH5428379]